MLSKNFNGIKNLNISKYTKLPLRVVVPGVRPFIFVEHGKIISKFPLIDLFTDLFPKDLTFFEMNGYEIGTMDSNGTYSGLLGYVQRGEAVGIFHPVPYDLVSLIGKFGSPIYDSGFGTVKLIKFPTKQANDLTSCFLDIRTSIIVLFFVFYFLIVLIISYLLPKKTKLQDACLVLYRIMLKEHNLNIKTLNYKAFVGCILIYYLLLNIIIEQNVNTNLVVNTSPNYVDKIEQIYEDKKLMVHFLKGHYTYQYFKNHMGNPVLKEIYERSSQRCNNLCLNDKNQFLHYVYYDLEEDEKEYLNTHLAIADENTQMYLMKAICNQNSEWITKVGIIRKGPFFYRQIFALFTSQHLPDYLLGLLNRKTTYIVESGLVIYFLNGFKNNGFGYVKNIEASFKSCTRTNEITNLQGVYSIIKVANIRNFLGSIMAFYLVLYLAFSVELIISFLISFFK